MELTTGSVNGDKFYDYARGSLIPQMLPYDGTNHKSIAVLDNCSIHHTAEVTELFRSAGILVLYLPPYSPDLMPIEETFSSVKYYLKEHDEIWQAMENPIPLIQAAFEDIQVSHCDSWILDCYYNTTGYIHHAFSLCIFPKTFLTSSSSKIHSFLPLSPWL